MTTTLRLAPSESPGRVSSMPGMEIVTQKLRSMKINELTPHPTNPNQGDVGAIHTSIEANGFYGAIVVQKSTGYVLSGNHRLIAAQQAGATSLPVIEVDVDDATALRILLADNRIAALASNDATALTELLQAIAATDTGLIGTGYDGDDLDALLGDLNAPPGIKAEAAPPVPGNSRGRQFECPSCGHVWAEGAA